MARSIIVNGVERVSTVVRIGGRFGHSAWFEKSAISEIVLDDLTNSIPHTDVAGLKKVIVTEDGPGTPTRLLCGRIGDHTVMRPDHVIGSARQWGLHVQDTNWELRGFRNLGWSRPAETDVERVLALHEYFLNGDASISPRKRSSTQLSTTYVSEANPVDLPAKVYTDYELVDIFREIAEYSGKLFFVTIDEEIFYDEHDSTAYAASLSIAPNGNGTTSFAPLAGVNSRHAAQEIYTGGAMRYGAGENYVEGSDIHGGESFHDKWEKVFSSSEIETAAEAQAYLNQIIAFQQNEGISYQCTIQLNADQVDLVKPGQTLEFRHPAVDAGSTRTLRVVDLQWEPVGPARYNCHLELGFPRIPPPRHGSKRSVPLPPAQPQPPAEGGAVRLYHSGHQAGGANTPESSASPNLDNAHLDGDWDTNTGAAYEMFQLYDSPSHAVNGETSWSAVNAAAQTVAMRGYLKKLEGDLLAVIKSGGEVRSQIRARSRHGVGVSEGAQNDVSAWGIRVYRPGSGFVATLVPVQAGGSSKFPAQATHINRIWQADFSGYGDAEEGDYVVIEYGVEHINPTTGAAGAALYFRANSGVDDLPEDQVTSTNLNSWVEFRGATTGGSSGDVPEPVGEDGEGSPGTQTGTFAPIDHVHPHGLLSESGTRYHDAVDIEYDNTDSGLGATNVQDAIDEIAAGGAGAAIEPSSDSPITVTDDSANNSFPGIARMANGNLILVYRAGTDHASTQDGKIVRKISTDDGATWGSAADVINPSDDARDPEVTVLSDGTVIVSYFEWDGSTGYQLRVIKSTDNGSTWGSPISASSSFSKEACSAKVVELPNGDLLLPAYGNNGSGDYTSFTLRSTDGGDTWGSQATIASGENFAEPYVLLMSDGRLLAAIREEDGRDIWMAYSDDLGATWGTAVSMFPGWARPALIETKAGALLCVTRSDDDDEHAIWRQSWDYGATWSDEANLESSGEGMTYASMVQVGDRIITAYALEPDDDDADVYVRDFLDVADQRFSNESRLRVQAADGTPVAFGVDTLRFSDASLNADGSVSVAVGAGGVTEADVRDAGRWEVVVDGNPAEAVTTEDGTDWVYGWVSGS